MEKKYEFSEVRARRAIRQAIRRTLQQGLFIITIE
nr:MAG TPA: hypothetical protein [Crassvirales sp.]